MNNYLDVENLIKSRRDTKNFLSKKISKKNISKILEMGIWSPNHRMTEPWTFVPIESDPAIIHFDNPQRALPPGQVLSLIHN